MAGARTRGGRSIISSVLRDFQKVWSFFSFFSAEVKVSANDYNQGLNLTALMRFLNV